VYIVLVVWLFCCDLTTQCSVSTAVLLMGLYNKQAYIGL